MATVIEQQPFFGNSIGSAVGQDLIYVVSNNTLVAQFKKVKFIAQVHISKGAPPNLSLPDDVVGEFKVTPNNAGVGVFNMENIVENFMKPDNIGGSEGSIFSNYKGTSGDDDPHPLHLIDEFSFSDNISRWMAIQFKIEYLGATTCGGFQDDDVVSIACGQAVNAPGVMLFNGYVKHTDIITRTGQFNQNLGFNIQTRTPSLHITGNTSSFLTNAPTTQFANLEDYGVMGYIDPKFFGGSSTADVDDIQFKYFASDGTVLGSELVPKSNLTGAYSGAGATTWTSQRYIMYVGVYPGNLRNHSATFNNLITAGTIQGGYYQVYLRSAAHIPLTRTYRIYLNCPDSKGYESIRLCWLNQWGAWDYFTFNKKSTRTISSKGSTYTQLGGTWNESLYRNYGYKGGKKSFRVNATERIKMNTDYISEDFNTTFEELINSPEVYMLEGFQTDLADSDLTNYVTPVRLTTSNFTKKTVANDKLIQYTFEIETSRNLKTQSV